MRIGICSFFIILWTQFAYGGQVLMSCDFSGFQGVDDIQVKNTSSGLRVEVYMVEQKNSYYSLPLNGSSGDRIDLSGFNIFNDFENVRLIKINGQWFFKADKDISQRVSCSILN